MAILQPCHILIVDDEEIVRQTLVRFLQDFGHSVDEVDNGSSALEAIKTSNYDLALVDLRMPGLNGLDLLARLRTESLDLPIVIISGHRDQRITDQALQLGISDFLAKPFQFTELEALITKYTVRV